jgi:hypothetical protein
MNHKGNSVPLGRVRLQISFPYKLDTAQLIFEKLCMVISAAQSRKLRTDGKPLLIVNADSRKSFEAFTEFAQRKKLDIGKLCCVHSVYSVDTCQMWLHGFGIVLDENGKVPEGRKERGLLHIPGDLKRVHSTENFIRSLNEMIERLQGGHDFIVGDFDVTPDPKSGGPTAKELIDLYGTYPLMYNWFPTVAAELRRKGIQRPRSEFFALSLPFLQAWLQRRKFAYEQTLAFLIYAISEPHGMQQGPGHARWSVEKVDIGRVGDLANDRGFRQATDQVERTERVLRLLWREAAEDAGRTYRDFLSLDQRSTSIRVNALVCFENILGRSQAATASA